jgi:DNA-binding protein YbaB
VADQSAYGTDALLRLLGETRQALESMRHTEPPDPEQVRGTGSAADGQVVATVVAPNQLESLQINPRLMRLGSEDLAERIQAAVNAAFAEFATKAREQMPGQATVDTGELAGRLRSLQDESVRSMEAFSQAMSEALARVHRSGR